MTLLLWASMLLPRFPGDAVDLDAAEPASPALVAGVRWALAGLALLMVASGAVAAWRSRRSAGE